MPNAFAHIELTTDDLKAAQKFYGKVFAWKLSDMPGMNYTMIDVGGGTGGGMQARPMPDAPTGWMPYVQVDDVKATVAKAVKAGATAMLAYQEIGDMGAIGIFRDPTGAAIGVWEAKQASAPAEPTDDKPAKKVSAKTAAKPTAKAATKPATKTAAKPATKTAPNSKSAKAAKKAPPAKKAPAAKKKKA